MGTRVECLVHAGRADAIAAVEALFAEWHARLSRFDPASELSRLNARAGQDVAVSAVLFEVAQAALRAAEATDGIFDPTLLRQIEGLGYDRTFALVLPEAPDRPLAVRTPRPGGGWRSMSLDPRRRTIRLPAGHGLDLGGIAKGMAVDAAVQLLESMAATPGAVDAGGDLAVLGDPPGGGAGWPVAIELPAGTRTVTLERGALATSGVSRRSWRRGGLRLHHIVDPRSGLPAMYAQGGPWSVSVAASSNEKGEVAAKVAFILGPAAGGRFLEVNGLPGLFVLEDGTTIEVGPWLGAANGSAAGAPTPGARAD